MYTGQDSPATTPCQIIICIWDYVRNEIAVQTAKKVKGMIDQGERPYGFTI